MSESYSWQIALRTLGSWKTPDSSVKEAFIFDLLRHGWFLVEHDLGAILRKGLLLVWGPLIRLDWPGSPWNGLRSCLSSAGFRSTHHHIRLSHFLFFFFF